MIIGIPPMKKLLDIISKGTGRLTKSHFDKKDINNEAYRIEQLAKAEAKGIGIISEAIKEHSE